MPMECGSPTAARYVPAQRDATEEGMMPMACGSLTAARYVPAQRDATEELLCLWSAAV